MPTELVIVVGPGSDAMLDVDSLRSAVGTQVDVRVCECETVGGLLGGAALIVIDASVAEPSAVLRRLAEGHRDLDIVVVGTHAHGQRVRQDMRRAPMPGVRWTTLTHNEVASGRLAGMVKQAAQRRRFTATIASTNAQLERSAQVKVAPLPVVSDHLLATILAHARNAIVVVDDAGHVLLWNSGAEHLFGKTSDEVLGKTVAVAMIGFDGAQAVQAAVTQGESGEIMCSQVGSVDPTTVSVAVSPLPGPGAGATLMIYDLTERARIERQLKEQALELGRSNADLQQFAYVASHDLQEPLRMISNYTELVQHRHAAQLNEGGKHHLKQVADAAARLRAMVDSILGYAQVARQQVISTPVPMAAVVEAAVANLDQAIAERDATVSIRPLPTVLGDRVLLTQVVQNLIANGIKFQKERRPEIEISGDEDPSEWRIHVRDNGIGIDPVELGKLFKLFQRLNPRSHYPGTGIGLASCKRIVERHGGRIWVESEPLMGSVFTFSIPKRSESISRRRATGNASTK